MLVTPQGFSESIQLLEEEINKMVKWRWKKRAPEDMRLWLKRKKEFPSFFKGFEETGEKSKNSR